MEDVFLRFHIISQISIKAIDANSIFEFFGTSASILYFIYFPIISFGKIFACPPSSLTLIKPTICFKQGNVMRFEILCICSRFYIFTNKLYLPFFTQTPFLFLMFVNSLLESSGFRPYNAYIFNNSVR